MAEIQIEEAPKQIQDLFNRGFTAFERGNLDYAIDLFFSCVEQEPRLQKARKFLRAAEIRKYKQRKRNALSNLVDAVKAFPGYLRAQAMLKSGKADRALTAAETLLRNDPVNPRLVRTFAEAAASANLPSAAIQCLETAREHNPDNISILNYLGVLYQKTGRTRSARECFEKLCEISPNDPSAMKCLKDAMALDSMKTDGWQEASEQAGTYRDLIRDTDEAKVLEQESKAVKSSKDVEALIAEMLVRLEKEPENMNYRRELARLYAQNSRFDEARDVLKKALELSPGDPELENALNDLRVREYDHEIARLKAEGDEQGAEAKAREKKGYEFKNLAAMMERYPNDLNLRYRYGLTLFERGELDQAIQQFQLSQKNPKLRINSFYYLAMCFKQKRQYDLAVGQLERAASELYSMDETKKDILYELGQISESMDQRQKAADYYKQIYQVDIGYKDISRKVEEVYKDELE
ncbi:MAG: tetratricopeptide repeat protein [Kiritimatiellia bacterium]